MFTHPPNVGWKTAFAKWPYPGIKFLVQKLIKKEAVASFNEISYKSYAFLHLFLIRNYQSLMFSRGCDVCLHAGHLCPGADKLLPSWLLYLAASSVFRDP
ncbi:MAG: hypothetical protein JWQ28_2378 [Pedobacter sp.]|nr:hypothetical protein [Pedobacter sp.]